MTKREYVEALAKLYYAANLSDTEYKLPWQNGDESAVHCHAFDKIVHDLGLSDIWGNIIEGDCLDQIDREDDGILAERALAHAELANDLVGR